MGLVAVSQVCVAAQSPSPPLLTGKMAPFTYLLDAPWTCVTNVPAMMGKPAHSETGTVTFTSQPNNVMHVHVNSGDYYSDQYVGYSTQANAYWSSASDSAGMAVSEQSPDGRVFKGIAALAGMTGSAQDVYARVTGTHVTVHSTTSLGGQQITTDSDCKR